MGKPAARKSDLCTGHGCFPPRPNVEGSSTVFINSRPAHRKGDSWALHCCSKKGCHGAITVTGSASVMVNGKPLAKVEDKLNCTSKIMTGSDNVYCG